MKNTKTLYDGWCREIAQSRDLDELVTHLRDHVGNHYDRYDRTEPGSLETWLVGVFSFANILKYKFPNITDEDLLYKMCTYYQWSGKGPKPTFDDKEFVEKYNGSIKEIQLKKEAKQKQKI